MAVRHDYTAGMKMMMKIKRDSDGTHGRLKPLN